MYIKSAWFVNWNDFDKHENQLVISCLGGEGLFVISEYGIFSSSWEDWSPIKKNKRCIDKCDVMYMYISSFTSNVSIRVDINLNVLSTFQMNLVSTMPADALTSCITRLSVAMVL